MRSEMEKLILKAYEEELKKITAAAQKSMEVIANQKRNLDDDDPR